MNTTKYRIYADNTVVHEFNFEEYDDAQPYHDDYSVYEIPDLIIEHIEEEGKL